MCDENKELASIFQSLMRCFFIVVAGACGVTLGGEGDPVAVKELGLLSFETSLGAPAVEAEADIPGGGASVRKREVEMKPQPFILSETLPVLPTKLVKKITRGDFVDMAELIKDNIEAERRRLASEGELSQVLIGQAICRREAPDLISWLQCFSSYAAVVCSKFPDTARELWTYQATMISEFWWCGGGGWRLSATIFCQHISLMESTDFNKINQGLYTTMFLAYGGKGSSARAACSLTTPMRSVSCILTGWCL